MITAKPKKRYWQIADDYWDIQSSDLSFVGRFEDGYIEITQSQYLYKLSVRWVIRRLLSIPPTIHIEANLANGIGEPVYLRGTQQIIGRIISHSYREKCIGTTTEYTDNFIKTWTQIGFPIKFHDSRSLDCQNENP